MALVFGDARGNVHTVDSKTGTQIWKAEARHDAFGGITGAPVLVGNRIIVPISSSGVGRGADPKYECCEGHGAVVALDATDGQKLWTAHTMEDAKYRQSQLDRREATRAVRRADLVDAAVESKRRLVYPARDKRPPAGHQHERCGAGDGSRERAS